jgi:hypothetical protein
MQFRRDVEKRSLRTDAAELSEAPAMLDRSRRLVPIDLKKRRGLDTGGLALYLTNRLFN